MQEPDPGAEAMMAAMEPDLATAPELAGVLDELRRREPVFHRPEFGSTRADFERMTADDFWEIGASGNRYSRAHVLDVLERRAPDPAEHDWTTRDFQCRELAPQTYLLTYTLEQGERLSRRSTIWRRHGSDWQIVFHQGTLVEGGG
ncbi:MAG: nuclear transport factor 2 family protein [Rhodanobacter sp.]